MALQQLCLAVSRRDMSIEGLFKLGWILLATSSDGLLFLYFFILKSYNKNTVYICSLGEERVYMTNMQGSSSAIDIKKKEKRMTFSA